MVLADTLLSMTISLGVMTAAVAVWSDVRATRQTVETLEQLHTQQREVQRLLERLSLSAGGTVLTQNADGAVRWLLKPVPVSGIEGARDDTLTWQVPREIDPRDCQGNQVSSLDLIAHQFKLSSKQELTCKDSQRTGTLFQALAERVEDLQVLYAEATPAMGSDPNMAALQWKTAAQVLDWQQVRALQLCLRWSSTSKLLQGQTVTPGCQGETVVADGRLRRLQRMTLRLASQGDG
jgi:Tfp pilus assembly protein PilW